MQRNAKIVKKTYLANWWNQTVVAGGSVTPTAEIQSACREMYVKSVMWSQFLQETVSFQPLPAEMNNIVETRLYFGDTAVIGAATGPCLSFVSTAAPPPDANGWIVLPGPGQYYFDNIMFSNSVFFRWWCGNWDVATSIDASCTLLVEVEEIYY